MKNRFTLLTIAALALCLSLPFAAHAQRNQKAQGRAIPPGPCHQNTRLCLQRMNVQISKLRAYVAHVKPGDTVKFNPQPDPPGDPDPWSRSAGEAYRSLLAELSDLSDHVTDAPIYIFPPQKANAGRAAISDAQAKLNSLGQSPKRSEVNVTLSQLSASVRRLSNSLATPLLRR